MERFTIVDENEDSKLKVSVSNDDIKIVKLEGELDYYTRNKLNTVVDSLFTQGNVSFILDLLDITFIDSSGLSSLVLTKRLIENKGGTMPCCFSDVVQRVLLLAGLEKFFLSCKTLDEAKVNLINA